MPPHARTIDASVQGYMDNVRGGSLLKPSFREAHRAMIITLLLLLSWSSSPEAVFHRTMIVDWVPYHTRD